MNRKQAFTRQVLTTMKHFIDIEKPEDKLQISGGKFGTLEVFKTQNRAFIQLRGYETIIGGTRDKASVSFQGSFLADGFAVVGMYAGSTFSGYGTSDRTDRYIELRFAWLIKYLNASGHAKALKARVFRAVSNISVRPDKIIYGYFYRGKQITEDEFNALPEVVQRDVIKKSLNGNTVIQKDEFFGEDVYKRLSGSIKRLSVAKFQAMRDFIPVPLTERS